MFLHVLMFVLHNIDLLLTDFPAFRMVEGNPVYADDAPLKSQTFFRQISSRVIMASTLDSFVNRKL